MTSQTPEEREIEEVVEDFVKCMWYVTGESQYPEGAEKKSYHQGFSDAVAMAYIELTGTPKSKGLIDKLLLSQQQKHREELQKAREEERERIIKLIDWRGKGFHSGSEVVAWIDEQLKTLNHSELDQDTELLNSVKKDWDKQAENMMNKFLDAEIKWVDIDNGLGKYMLASQVIEQAHKVFTEYQETHHQQLQKAREEEKMGILKIALTMGDCPINNPKADAGWMKFQHDFCLKLTKDNKKSILSETDHSELDQDTELLNSVKEDWDKQAKNAMNGLDQEVSK